MAWIDDDEVADDRSPGKSAGSAAGAQHLGEVGAGGADSGQNSEEERGAKAGADAEGKRGRVDADGIAPRQISGSDGEQIFNADGG